MKHIPLIIFVAFALKALIIAPTVQDVACLSVVGALTFFCEKGLRDKKLEAMSKKLDEAAAHILVVKADADAAKSYVTSLKLQGKGLPIHGLANR